MATTYRIEARRSSSDPDSELYQVTDNDGHEYCRDAAGNVADTPSFRLAVECYAGLTGEDPDEIDDFHALLIDGVEQSRLD